MNDYINDFTSHLKDALNIGNNTSLDPKFNTIDSVLICGLGGSGIGGTIVNDIIGENAKVPIVASKDYSIPNFVSKNTLVIVNSYSGNTEETISACEQAMHQDATIIVVSSGGILSGMCELSETMYLISCPGGQPPRSAFGHIFSRQLALMVEIGILQCELTDDAMQRLQEAVEDSDIINHPEGDVASLALNMLEHPIALLGPDELSPAINRFKNQLNENAARFARTGYFPEMNHNESVAWGGVGGDMDPESPNQALILLSWDGMHPRVEQRMDWFVSNCPTEMTWSVHGDGESLLECLIHLCIMTDWLSIALALLHGKDPSAIEPILSLKDFLSQINQ
mgnify:CR=1 FL=1